MGVSITEESTNSLPRNERRRRVLLVTYTFPPVGGAGVQRVAKFAKYLPRHGWDVSVLTAANPSVPTFDHELAKEVPAETKILHARTLEPSYAVKSAIGSATSSSRGIAGRARAAAKRVARSVAGSLLQPDPQILWRRDALRVGLEALRSEHHDAILVSGPPFSAFCIAAELARRTGTPLVLDYRDDWDISNRSWENKRLGPVSTRIQQRMQRRVLRAANAVVATTPASAADLERICRSAGSRAKTTCIYNGYDADHFSEAPLESQSQQDHQLRLTYVGTLWNLTTIAPLVEAIELLQRDTPELAKRLRLVIAGRRTPGEQAIVDRLKSNTGLLEEHTYVEHHQALNLMKCSDLLCVLLANVPGAGRVMPAKVFEYLATGIPILAIAPQGEMTQVLARAPNAHAMSPADVPAIHGFLRAALEAFGADRSRSRVAGNYPEFERNHQAGELAELLTRVAAVSPAHI
jgi:glycosyltransferase involved in cell wall biosynthesis